MSSDLASALGRLATEALTVELETEPKPGLVTPSSTGSHADMDAAVFRRSIAALEAYFAQFAALGRAGVPFRQLQACGVAAEHAMFRATGGVNTHKGAIFTLGLLCAAAGRALISGRNDGDLCLGARVQDLWGEAIARSGAMAAPSHGQQALLRHGIPGAREQAAAGFPTLYKVTLPALRLSLERSSSRNHACIHALLSTVAVTPDTNLVHRGGPQALAWAQSAAERFLATGGIFAPDGAVRLQELCGGFVQRRLSPGGSADLLAAAWLVIRIEQDYGIRTATKRQREACTN